MNNVAYSCPWPSLWETARVTAHNRRAHLTGSACWSVTTTQNGQMPFPRVDRHAQISTALTEFNRRFVILDHLPGIYSVCTVAIDIEDTWAATSAAQRQRQLHSSIPPCAQARMGCSTSTHTTAVDTSRPSAKPEEMNGATVTGDLQNFN